MWRLAAISCSNDGSRFGRVQFREILRTSLTLQEALRETRKRMDERQQHLVAAAEAMRTWIHKQRAVWAEGYPQSLRQVQPQFAALMILTPPACCCAHGWNAEGIGSSKLRTDYKPSLRLKPSRPT